MAPRGPAAPPRAEARPFETKARLRAEAGRSAVRAFAVLPVIAGQILYIIETNMRSATIIGVVRHGRSSPTARLIG